MSQAPDDGGIYVAANPYDIGWWIESADEEKYGPVSRKTLRQFLEDGSITPNTLVCHCSQAEAKPVADQPDMMQGVKLDANAPTIGDRMAEVWPRKWRQQVALAEDSLPCARHNRPAVLFCVRCHAPYCNRCRMKPYGRRYYMCRKCQASNYHRRFVAFIADSALFNYVPVALALALSAAETLWVGLAQVAGAVVFMLRDALFGGAGPGKRLMGLRVVKAQDGTPLSYGQAFLRWISLAIPLFNLVDLSISYRDRLQRRYGDRWAKTRVIDTGRTLARVRAKIRNWLARKDVTLASEGGMTMKQFARLV
jgi:uncharacterized RDD family membrane protein YckC